MLSNRPFARPNPLGKGVYFHQQADVVLSDIDQVTKPRQHSERKQRHGQRPDGDSGCTRLQGAQGRYADTHSGSKVRLSDTSSAPCQLNAAPEFTQGGHGGWSDLVVSHNVIILYFNAL